MEKELNILGLHFGHDSSVAIVKNGIAELVDVETGYRTVGAVEITKGLNIGDSVIVAGMLFVRQGSKIKVGKTIPIIDITK